MLIIESPIVGLYCSRNSPLTNIFARALLPTPSAPIKTILCIIFLPLGSLLDTNSKLTDAEAEVVTLKQDVLDVQGKLSIAESNEIPKEDVQATRDEATRLYKLIKGDKVDEAILASINKMDFSSANSFKKQYETEADEKFPLVCGECKSPNISRASTAVEDPDSNNQGSKVISNADASKKLKEAGRAKKQSIAIGYNK